ncbi:MAG: hypothetical protein E7022_04960 [Desulfovibrio desulfuricans]|jgi:hypothetical protein|uniref:hypothetical protein n=1 Tax=uncultured Desulfovibrio sp. TaxID=167968 RepID=UPI00262DC5A8|nr:hypothetical protein [uncultured Desulfovibrio sp.]MBE6441666.1 hypothetical protein [Desulfovibrio desulfuricans]
MKHVLFVALCFALMFGAGCTQRRVPAAQPQAGQARQPLPPLRKHDENYWPEVRKANESYRPPEYSFGR